MERDFRNPPFEYRPLQMIHGFGQIEGLGIRASLMGLKDMGIGGVVVNIGLENYMFDEGQWEILRDGVKEAKRLGFVIWLYDEKGYPSGTAGGLTLEGHPEFEAIGLTRMKDSSGGAVFREITLYEGTHATENLYENRHYINIIDRDAVARFVDITHEEYARRFREELSSYFSAIFTDEPSLMNYHINPEGECQPVVPWQKELPDVFEKEKGYSIIQHLDRLFEGSETDCKKVRCDFYDVISRMCAENYFGQIQDWCRAHMIASTGHLLGEENLVWHIYLEGSLFESLRRMDIPGIDMLDSVPQEIMGGRELLVPKFISSAAHISGKELTMSETSEYVQRAAGRPVSVDEMIGALNIQYAMGINRITSYYQWDSYLKRSDEIGDVGAEEYKLFNDCVGRLAVVLTGGKHVADVAVLYPITSAWANFYPTGRSFYDPHPNEFLKFMENEFLEISRALITNQIDYDYVDDRALREASIEDGTLVLNGERHSTIVIPPMDAIIPHTILKIEDFVSDGGTAIFVRSLPEIAAGLRLDDGEVKESVRRIFGGGLKGVAKLITNGREALIDSLNDSIVPDMTLAPPNPDVIYLHRVKGGRDIYFIVNTSSAPVEMRASFRLIGKPELWSPETGMIYGGGGGSRISGGRTELELLIPGYKGMFVVF